MAVVISDRFTDTPGTQVEAHTPDVGGPWIKIFNAAEITDAGTGVVNPQDADDHYSPFISTQNSAGDDQMATMLVHTGVGYPSQSWFSLQLRNSSDDLNRYAFSYGSGGWTLSKVVAGVETSLDTHVVAVAADTDYELVASVVGNVLSLELDGVEILSAVDSDLSGATNRRMGFRIDQRDPSGGYTETQLHKIMDYIGEDFAVVGGEIHSKVGSRMLGSHRLHSSLVGGR